MAFPNITTSFTTLVDLKDLYRASHVNALQTAVDAIIAAMPHKANTTVVAEARGDYTTLTSALAATDPTVATGTAQAGTASTITLAAAASATDHYYVGMRVRITGGTGLNQMRTIVLYDGTTKVATIGQPWDANPDATSTYSVKKIETILLYPGEYIEDVELVDCVDIIAIDPQASLVYGWVTDNGDPCACNLSINVIGGPQCVITTNAWTELNMVGEIWSPVATAISNGGGLINFTGTIHNVLTTGTGITNDNAYAVTNFKGDIDTNGMGIDISDGIVNVRDAVITNSGNTANHHGITISGGVLTCQNVKIVCTHGSANSIYAAAPQNAYCMSVWANRDDHANITQQITNGFNYDADVQ